jgi:MFS family permease
MIAASTAFAGVFWQLIAVRLCLGLAESTVYPGGLSWIRRHIPEHHRGLAIGVFNSGSKWGPAIAAPLAAWILSHYGWRQMFLLLGLGGSFPGCYSPMKTRFRRGARSSRNLPFECYSALA